MNWDFEHFTPEEMASKDGTPFPSNYQSHAFMRNLDNLRGFLGFPLVVTNGFRSKHDNERVGGAINSAHLYGLAVDISIHGEHAYSLIGFAPRFGFTGIGIKQHGPFEKRFVHLDMMDNDVKAGIPRPRVWTYA